MSIIPEKTKKKIETREKKRKPKMKVSGKTIFKLNKIKNEIHR